MKDGRCKWDGEQFRVFMILVLFIIIGLCLLTGCTSTKPTCNWTEIQCSTTLTIYVPFCYVSEKRKIRICMCSQYKTQEYCEPPLNNWEARNDLLLRELKE